MKEREERLEIDLDFKDLLWEFARRWRVIVCLIIVGAVLMGAKQYRTDLAKAKAAQPVTYQVVEQQAQTEYELNLDEMETVLYAVHLKADIDGKAKYLSESLLMSIHAYEESRTILQYVTSDESACAQTVNAIESGAFGEALAAAGIVDAKASYLSELVSVETLADGVSYTVTVIANDDATANALADVIVAKISNSSLIKRSTTQVVDTELAELQNQYAMDVKTDSDTLKKSKSEMTGNQLAVYLQLVDDTIFPWGAEEEETVTEAPVAAPAAQTISVSISPKALVKGGILGAVLALVLIFFAYVLTGKLRTAQEMKQLYGVRVLGGTRICSRKALKGIDLAIWKGQHRDRAALEEAQELDMIVTAIAVCEKKNVYLTGSRIENLPAAAIEQLIEKLAAKQIEAVCGKNLLNHADALAEAKAAQTVVLLEEKRASRYGQIIKAVRILNENDITVLGAAVLGD